jgi:biotin carboxyl carrier protein
MSELDFIVNENSVTTSSARDNESIIVKVGNDEYHFRFIGENLCQVQFNGDNHIVAVIKAKDVYYVDIDATVIEVREAGASQSNAGSPTHAAVKDRVFAPMPGKIVKLLVKVGDSVNSPASGTVKKVNFAVGDQVNTTSPILELKLD